MSIQQMLFAGKIPFTPVTNQYAWRSGTTTETVPANASQCVIEIYSGGGGGANSNSPGANAGGGGGGSYVKKTIAVSGGQTMTYGGGGNGTGATAGSAANGGDGTDATVTGTVTGGTLNLRAGAGKGGKAASLGAAGGAGGVASGGDTNTNGTIGQYSTTPQGGAGGGPNGGAPDSYLSGNITPANQGVGGYGVPNSSAQDGSAYIGTGGKWAFKFAYT